MLVELAGMEPDGLDAMATESTLRNAEMDPISNSTLYTSAMTKLSSKFLDKIDAWSETEYKYPYGSATLAVNISDSLPCVEASMNIGSNLVKSRPPVTGKSRRRGIANYQGREFV